MLYKLVRYPFAPELSDKWEVRMKGLQSLVKRAARYGIKVYLYLNEPRCMPSSFFKTHPELLGYDNGNGEATLCTSLPQVPGISVRQRHTDMQSGAANWADSLP